MKEQAVQMLVELEGDIDDYLSVIGMDGIKEHFQATGELSLQRHGNTLETAAYFAAAENDDYCNGLYRN